MDQRHLVGVGNIYANEALFAAGIDPSKPARTPHAGGSPPAASRRSGGSCRRRSPPTGPPSATIAPAPASRELPARAPGLRPRGRALPPLRHPAHRHARHRRAHHRLLPSLSVVSRTPSPERRRAHSRSPTSTQLRRRVRALAENRPAVYRMLDASGPGLYVGKAKRLRTRLLTYFRAELSRRQGGADSVRGARHRLGLRAQRVRRLSRRAAADPAVPPALQLPRQPDPPGRVHQDLRRARATGLRRRDHRP